MRSRLLLHYSQPNGEMYDSENGSDIWCGCITVWEIIRSTDIVIITVYGSQSPQTSRNFIFPPELKVQETADFDPTGKIHYLRLNKY